MLQTYVNFILSPRKFIPDIFFRNQSHKLKKINKRILNSLFTLKNFANLVNINIDLSFLKEKSKLTSTIRNSLYARPL